MMRATLPLVVCILLLQCASILATSADDKHVNGLMLANITQAPTALSLLIPNNQTDSTAVLPEQKEDKLAKKKRKYGPAFSEISLMRKFQITLTFVVYLFVISMRWFDITPFVPHYITSAIERFLKVRPPKDFIKPGEGHQGPLKRRTRLRKRTGNASSSKKKKKKMEEEKATEKKNDKEGRSLGEGEDYLEKLEMLWMPMSWISVTSGVEEFFGTTGRFFKDFQGLVTSDPVSCINLLVCDVEKAHEKYASLNEEFNEYQNVLDDDRHQHESKTCSEAERQCKLPLSKFARYLKQARFW